MSNRAFDGTISDGEKYDNQWVFVFQGRCRACAQELGQKLVFPRWDPEGRECPKVEDMVVEIEMFKALARNHPCRRAGDLVGPDGRKLQGNA